MRMMDDIMFAKEQDCGLDLVLGGNEDLYYRELFEDSEVFILKSGSDFFDFTNLIVLEGVSEEDY